MAAIDEAPIRKGFPKRMLTPQKQRLRPCQAGVVWRMKFFHGANTTLTPF
jgi:hypothetical protein